MASYARKFLTIFLLLSVAVLFFSTLEVEAKVCQWRSRTWQGICGNTIDCRNKCINVEFANVGGECKRDGLGVACFCYYNC
ncbi:putative defensin, plant [Medicago truncatula]|uniref:Defensin-like protein n=1 Tax=Medicago truncatula TaxID=3880 RepID=A0A072TKX6_MEDTR|nr:Defensin-like protein [Medicago truncatula]RHN39054.1 putative defensin, plant [Medicago truncatula]